MKSPKKTVLVFSSTYPRWKNDTSPPFVHELSKRLVEDFNIIVLAPHYPGALTREKMEGVQIIRYRYFWSKFEILAGETSILPTLKRKKYLCFILPFFILSGFCSLLYHTKKLKIDLIHAHWTIPQGLQAAVTGKLTKVPFVVTSHGIDAFGLQGSFWHFCKQFVFNNAKAITVVSRAIEDEIQANYPSIVGAIKVLPMGVDSNLFSPTQKNPELRIRYQIPENFLLFIGRLSEKKGLKYLIEAMPSVIKANPETKLLVVGKGELEQELHELVKKMSLAEHIDFMGAVANRELPALYASADLFIAPSTKTDSGDVEGFGLTFVEAAMAGSLIIGTKTGGIGDIIINNETGFLVEDKNPAHLSNTINHILKNKQNLETIRTNARREAIKKFDWSVVAKGYSALISSVLKCSH